VPSSYIPEHPPAPQKNPTLSCQLRRGPVFDGTRSLRCETTPRRGRFDGHSKEKLTGSPSGCAPEQSCSRHSCRRPGVKNSPPLGKRQPAGSFPCSGLGTQLGSSSVPFPAMLPLRSSTPKKNNCRQSGIQKNRFNGGQQRRQTLALSTLYVVRTLERPAHVPTLERGNDPPKHAFPNNPAAGTRAAGPA
jgi:hypothetical protein